MTSERSEKLLKVLSKRQATLALLLENVEDPHNISAVMRTCDVLLAYKIFMCSPLRFQSITTGATEAAALHISGSQCTSFTTQKSAYSPFEATIQRF